MRGAIRDDISITPFQPTDQPEARALIMAGLGEHFGFADESLNPDLNDIATTYAEATFLVARRNGRMIGTGALVPRAGEVGEIVRMSVAPDARRAGVGSRILARLIEDARSRRLRRIILETNEAWGEVVAFYQRNGFRITHVNDGAYGREVWFEMALDES